MFVLIQGPTGATTERTAAVIDQIEDYYMTQESAAVDSVFAVSGFSFLAALSISALHVEGRSLPRLIALSSSRVAKCSSKSRARRYAIAFAAPVLAGIIWMRRWIVDQKRWGWMISFMKTPFACWLYAARTRHIRTDVFDF